MKKEEEEGKREGEWGDEERERGMMGDECNISAIHSSPTINHFPLRASIPLLILEALHKMLAIICI